MSLPGPQTLSLYLSFPESVSNVFILLSNIMLYFYDPYYVLEQVLWCTCLRVRVGANMSVSDQFDLM